eukprot:TRINITY_DN2615_c0_g1_i7.p1 TRINITY_DN2615_c0_g1~~TRINITY_DN2615_c0_g1_i7.p1  ORF type:complete len:360 (-),score=51.03 TRINITY_DN2615_c0_g1_i7:1066-2145(-)
MEEEDRFKQALAKKGLLIKEIDTDGNCLFRAISEQIYGTEEFHKLIRRICMDYIDIEREYFKNYIIGGIAKIDDYLHRKRQDGVWGDDVEIQALSEIYGRPVEIYAYSAEPMRTFHESALTAVEPMRISYHGKSHFNSIKRMGRENAGLVQTKFGVIEDSALKSAKIRVQRTMEAAATAELLLAAAGAHAGSLDEDKTGSGHMIGDEEKQLEMLSQDILRSRQDFDNKGIRDLETALAESLLSFNKEIEKKDIDVDLEQTIKESMDAFNDENVDKAIFQMAMEESIKNVGEDEDLQRVLEESRRTAPIPNDMSSSYSSAIQQVVDAGLPIELVMQAYAVVGDNAEAIFDYIYNNLLCQS